MAEALGTPLMPWQRLVADVGGELLEDGRPAFRSVVFTVPRQSGKTLLELAWELERALMWGDPQRIAYTAQTGWDARRKLVDDQVPLVQKSAVQGAVRRVYRGAGNEALVFKNGSRIDVLASTDDAGHGRTIDLAVLDEVFADTDDRREQALMPAMATRPMAQILVTSTAGTDTSLYFRRKVEAGRAAVVDGVTEGVAYFEWSAPDDADADDPAVWRACMPALGHTITEDVVRHARQTMTDGEFRRSYLNQWVTGDERIFPAELWEAVQDPTAAPQGLLVFAADVPPERNAAAVAVADQRGRTEIVDYRPGVGWVAARLQELAGRWPDSSIAIDAYGPAGFLVDILEGQGMQVHRYGSRQMAAACGTFYDRVADQRLFIRPSSALDAAVAGAQKRLVGDSWVWARKASTVDISPLVAATIAVDRASLVTEKVDPAAQVW